MNNTYGKVLRHLLLIMGMAEAVSSLSALDLLPDSSCRNRVNLQLLRQCDPYATQLIYVDPSRLTFQKNPGNRFRRGVPHSSPYPKQKRGVLQRLIRRYIDYQEQMQLWRSVQAPRAKVPSPAQATSRHATSRRMIVPATVIAETPSPPSRPMYSVISAERNISIASPKRQQPKEPKKREENLTSLPAPIPESAPSPLKPAIETQENNRSETLPAPVPEKNATAQPLPKAETFLTASPQPPAPPETLVHRVKAGESLIRLARRYRTTPYDIRRWNRLKRGHLLRIGEKLTIHPGKKSTPEEIRRGLLIESYGKYKVRKGDTLLGLARRFGVKAREIQGLNGLHRHQHLRIGQKLILPLSQKKIDAVVEREKGYRFKYTGDYRFKHKLRVAATAYTSHRSQTDSTPFLAAWNNRIRPGMKIIAVSPDLIRKYGITNGTKVKISGLRGIYTVRDKMNPRLHNHIDIYMGVNRRKALRWGRRSVILYW